MGHVHSKKKKNKYHKELSDYINRNVPGNHGYLDRQISQIDVDRFSHASEPFITNSKPGNKPKWVTMPITNDFNEGKSLLKTSTISYKDIKVDGHPALLNLQNEQNVRVEKMEERMNQIRLHAMQEADRRKYAYLFKAKTRQSPTKDLILKTKDKILNKHDKTNICDVKDNQNISLKSADKGEVIPVKTVRDSMKSCSEIQKADKIQRIPAFDSLNLSDPKSVLLLPFLLPIFLLLFVVRTISQAEKKKKDGPKRN